MKKHFSKIFKNFQKNLQKSFEKNFKKIFKKFLKIKKFSKSRSYASVHNQNLLYRSTSLINKIYEYNNLIFKNIESFYKKYSLILQYRFLQKLFNCKKSYYKKVGYNP